MNKKLIRLRALDLREPIAVVGMGVSGLATLDVLREAGYDAIGLDEKKTARHSKKITFSTKELAFANTIVLSPGIDKRREFIAASCAKIINDVEILGLLAEKPILAITGTNGKSTVVTMLTNALQATAKKVCLCGNIGMPILQAWLDSDDDLDYYVLELSSYQLEICPSLKVAIGAILNVTPDHLDRYDDFANYLAAKGNLATQAQKLICNADDSLMRTLAESCQQPIFFGTKEIEKHRIINDNIYINDERITAAKELRLKGKHNLENALVTLLILQETGNLNADSLAAIKKFSGLPHRMQLVDVVKGVHYIDDSKATNVASAVAALKGVTRPTWLIAGGVGKNQDFTLLAAALQQVKLQEILLIGVQNDDLRATLQKYQLPIRECGDIKTAVQYAKTKAQHGDCVLLAPGCASLDQFTDYVARGRAFAKEVLANGEK